MGAAWCPVCGRRLERTSTRHRWPRKKGRPVGHDEGLALRVSRLPSDPNW